MKIKIYYDSMGYTQKSLQNLRNELSRRIDHKVSVFQYSSNNICCGHIIIDKTSNEIVLTGDGFRTDGGGEGGSGYNSAQKLFHLFGIYAHHIDITPPILPYVESEQERKNEKLKIETRLLKELEKYDYLNYDDNHIDKLSDYSPGYIRN